MTCIAQGPPKRKSSAASPERKHIPDLMFGPTTPAKDKPAFKKRKCDVFVLVPSDRKHSVKPSPTSVKLDRKHAPSSPLKPVIDGPLDYSSDSSLTSLSDGDDEDDGWRPLSRRADTSRARTTSRGPSHVAQRPRSPDRDLTYFDPPPPMPRELEDRRDPTYVPSPPASPFRPTFTKRAPRTNASQNAGAPPKPLPKPLPLTSPVRSATISGKVRINSISLPPSRSSPLKSEPRCSLPPLAQKAGLAPPNNPRGVHQHHRRPNGA